jgi:hypothetical protein
MLIVHLPPKEFRLRVRAMDRSYRQPFYFLVVIDCCKYPGRTEPQSRSLLFSEMENKK